MRARAAGYGAAAVLLGVLAVLAWRHGVRSAAFPTAAGPTPVVGTYYSGPWLTTAVVAVLVAGLLLVRAAVALRAGPRR